MGSREMHGWNALEKVASRFRLIGGGAPPGGEGIGSRVRVGSRGMLSSRGRKSLRRNLAFRFGSPQGDELRAAGDLK